ncbi:MAG: SLBB domain-containing protein [Ignavibacteriales bacterium]|nr:SLBB domain-containing protein [Ignavibacteriales bacterium]
MKQVIRIAVLLWCMGTMLFGQDDDRSKSKSSDRTSLRMGLETIPASEIRMPTSNLPVMEGPINPAEYILGPSDVLNVAVWTSPSLTAELPITAEGTLIVPTVGEIRVAGLTLEEGRGKILAEIRKKYLVGNPTATLVVPRSVIVTIGGAVKNPGRYVLSAADRVDRAIQEANKTLREQAANLKQSVRAGETKVNDAGPFPESIASEDELERTAKDRVPSQRAIILRSSGGALHHVDLAKFAATRDGRWNPYVGGGDEIYVPRVEKNRNVFGVYGAVNKPGRYEFCEGDSLSDALSLGLGFRSTAVAESVMIFRQDSTTGMSKVRVINCTNSVLRNNVLLNAGDRIVVKGRNERREDNRVIVEGAVRNPGVYPIDRAGTKLNQVLALAGGITDDASLGSAVVLRNSISKDDYDVERLLALRAAIPPEDSIYYGIESELRLRREQVSVDLARLFYGQDTTQDIQLHNDDRIIIPFSQGSVYVMGQVAHPGYVDFEWGKDASYYLKKAGGFTLRAKEEDAVLIKRNSRQWVKLKGASVEEGDIIWVPRELERTMPYYLTVVSQAASIVGVALTIIVLSIQLSK